MQLMRSQPGVNLSAAVTATAAFDPPQVRAGEKAVYRVTFNATAISVKWPEKIPAPPGLVVQFNCSGQTMQVAGGAYENFAAFDYDVHAAVAGQFTMPEFTVEVYGKPVVIPAAQLDVEKDLPEPHEPVRQLFLAPSATNIFVGEKFDVSVILPATAAGAIEGVSDVQFNGDSFVVDNQLTRQSIQSVAVNGRNALAYVYKTSLTPIAAGKLNLSVQGFSLETEAGGPPKNVLLDSEPVVINVRPLPVENELPGFQGAVGDYTCDPPALTKSNLKVGEPTQLTIVIRGRGDPGRINPPLPLRVEGWQIFPAESEGRTGGARVPGVSFRYTLIPLTDTVRTTPAIPFSCFNPASGSYVDLTIPALPVTVFAGENQTNADTGLVFAEDDLEPGPKTGLSKLAQTPGWYRRSCAFANARLVSARPNFSRARFLRIVVLESPPPFSRTASGNCPPPRSPPRDCAANGGGWKNSPPKRTPPVLSGAPSTPCKSLARRIIRRCRAHWFAATFCKF